MSNTYSKKCTCGHSTVFCTVRTPKTAGTCRCVFTAAETTISTWDLNGLLLSLHCGYTYPPQAGGTIQKNTLDCWNKACRITGTSTTERYGPQALLNPVQREDLEDLRKELRPSPADATAARRHRLHLLNVVQVARTHRPPEISIVSPREHQEDELDDADFEALAPEPPVHNPGQATGSEVWCLDRLASTRKENWRHALHKKKVRRSLLYKALADSQLHQPCHP